MTDTRSSRVTRPPHAPFARRAWRRWMLVADWLGARRPLDLICGACAIIAGFAVLGHLLSPG